MMFIRREALLRLALPKVGILKVAIEGAAAKAAVVVAAALRSVRPEVWVAWAAGVVRAVEVVFPE